MIADEVRVFLLACIAGGGLGLVYDFLAGVRLLFPSSRTAAFLLDGVFFVVAGWVSFRLFQAVSYGRVRGFLLIGEWLGAVIFRLSVGMCVRFFLFSAVQRLKGIAHIVHFKSRKTVQSNENEEKIPASQNLT